MVRPERHTYQVKVTLKGSEPPIWRRLLVDSRLRLDQFHLVLQVAMGWENQHLHQFESNGVVFEPRIPDEPPRGKNEAKYRLGDVLVQEEDRMIYWYDFGDDWIHEIVLEKILPFDRKAPRARVIEGKRACPPEDVGGIGGYEYFLEARRDPAHPDHEHMMEWGGEEFDPEAFQPEQPNALLKKFLK
ncbi:pRiA4b ORF-3-like protein [Desulfacinum hydrothermale DSM 13146]|uniref:PRiA4b ORF-3-like protein n=1 Tax=Desulfacinum hydrothermale DSM 13146 TaxID=1121390 RepID=A0A1W1XI73_9BACT|nr:plasmid pRiA4b ORF-3 family protein [Desulfacinum hydrothermale]SMC23685.1 pRiA4b ORF-3-like protein [Desulfacinum hydrothermale DSM 13146]